MCSQVFLTNSANVFLLEPCQDVPKLLENQLDVCRAVLSVYRHIIMEQNMNRQTWSVTHDTTTLNLNRALLYFTSCSQTFSLLCASYYSREQLLQVLLRITEAVMKRPQENQRKDTFAHSLASILFKVSTNEQPKASYTPQGFSRLKMRRRWYHPDVHTYCTVPSTGWSKHYLQATDLGILIIRCIKAIFFIYTVHNQRQNISASYFFIFSDSL